VTFDYIINCNGTCADGMAVMWLNPQDAEDLEDGEGGERVGVPKAPGGAWSITLLKNFDTGTTEKAPTLTIHRLTDGMPGMTGSNQSSDTLVRSLRTVTMKYRKGKASFSIPGVATTSDQEAPGGFMGYFGFTAASGSQSQAAFVSSFRGVFADCDLP